MKYPRVVKHPNAMYYFVEIRKGVTTGTKDGFYMYTTAEGALRAALKYAKGIISTKNKKIKMLKNQLETAIGVLVEGDN